ncbi:unnamed protein product, partial [marine sediment metagenome]
SLFIRTSGCNLRCAWAGSDGNGSPCDTPYSSHSPEKNMMETEDVLLIARRNMDGIKHIVISGGEPLIQSAAVADLLKYTKHYRIHSTVETNGTKYDPKVSDNVNLISISPKLSSSTPWEPNLVNTGITYKEKWAIKHEKNRINIKAIQSYINDCWDVEYMKNEPDVIWKKERKHPDIKDFQLKFVVAELQDVIEIEEILEKLTGFKPSDVILMPEGVTTESTMEKAQWIAREAIMR